MGQLETGEPNVAQPDTGRPNPRQLALGVALG
jgi:hypothetical protein